MTFATAPGAVAFDGEGRNSPYAEALSQALRESGERIEDIFIRVRGLVADATNGQQVPWETSSLTKQVLLSDRNAGPKRTSRFDGTYYGAMICNPNNPSWGNPRFLRPEGDPIRVTIRGGQGVWKQGPSEPETRWSGGPPYRKLDFKILDDGRVRALGIDTGTIRPEIGIKVDILDLVFSGRIEDGEIRTTGRREDRRCRIELSRF